MKTNPFHLGDRVVYKPSLRGRGLLVMTDLAKLILGATYTVVEIENADYLVLEGFEKSWMKKKNNLKSVDVNEEIFFILYFYYFGNYRNSNNILCYI